MLRRDFLRRGAIAVAGGLLVGDAAIEAFARLTHVRKSFPSADIRGGFYSYDIWERLPNGMYSHRVETPNAVIHYWDEPKIPFATFREPDRDPIKVTVRSWVPKRTLAEIYGRV